MANPSYAQTRPGLRAEILARVAAGERVTAICAAAGMPCAESVTGWARRERQGFGAELAAAQAAGAWRRRFVCDEAVGRAILDGLSAGRAIGDVLRAPGMPSYRTYMMWRRTAPWFGEAVGRVLDGRVAWRNERLRGRHRPYDAAVGNEIYVRMWQGEGLRAILRSDPRFPSRAVLARWRREDLGFGELMRFIGRSKRTRRGRGCLCTPELTAEIIERIVAGASLRSLGREPGMPSARAMSNWMRTRGDFARAVEWACEQRAYEMCG